MSDVQRCVAARTLLAAMRVDAPEHMRTHSVAEFEDASTAKD
ncbi:MAG TPA: hypothetical protein VF053_15700 [Streptosporangiales bacterium]